MIELDKLKERVSKLRLKQREYARGHLLNAIEEALLNNKTKCYVNHIGFGFNESDFEKVLTELEDKFRVKRGWFFYTIDWS